jgi:hypothetical protein
MDAMRLLKDDHQKPAVRPKVAWVQSTSHFAKVLMDMNEITGGCTEPKKAKTPCAHRGPKASPLRDIPSRGYGPGQLDRPPPLILCQGDQDRQQARSSPAPSLQTSAQMARPTGFDPAISALTGR